MTINILFVCLGNICRSPLAEATFQQLIEERGLTSQFACDSVATHNYHPGQLPDYRARRVAADHGIMLTHKARKLASEDFAHFDYIMAMDESIFEEIQVQSHRSTGFDLPEDRLFMFRTFDSDITTTLDVPDPYYEDITAFEDVFEMVKRCNENLLDYLIEKHSV
jgi:protein-tyrosine phosphatase